MIHSAYYRHDAVDHSLQIRPFLQTLLHLGCLKDVIRDQSVRVGAQEMLQRGQTRNVTESNTPVTIHLFTVTGNLYYDDAVKKTA